MILELTVLPEFEDLIPKLSKPDFNNLLESIKKEGQIYPIIVNKKNVILDGHHRYQALKFLGIEPNVTVKDLSSQHDEFIFVIEANLKRRHLNAFQITEMGLLLHKLEAEKSKKRQTSKLKQNKKSLAPDEAIDMGKTSQKMAKRLGISTSTYERSMKILKSDDEKLKSRVRQGSMPINTAYTRIVKGEKELNPALSPLDIPEIKSPLNVLWYNMNFEFEDKYPAKMSPDFARDMIKIHSNRDDLVWDGFCGSGVVPRMAQKIGRRALGTDTNPKAIELCKKHAKNQKLKDIYSVDDVRKIKLKEKADLILSSPPFGLNIAGDKNQYSEEEDDLSNSETFAEFIDAMNPAIENYYDNLKPNGVMVLDARDRTKDGRYWDLINYFRNIALDVGFKMQCKYSYFLMPWSHYTYQHAVTHKVMPMVSTMDVIVMYKE